MLRAITLDLWETLIREDDAVKDERRDWRIREIGRLLSDHQITLLPDDLQRAHEKVLMELERIWTTHADLSVLEQTKLFLELARGRPIESWLPSELLIQAARLYGHAALEYPPSAMDGALDVLRDLHGRGLGMGLICNTGRTPGKVLREILSRMQMLDLFDVLLFSDELRRRKPDRQVFERALARLGALPDEAVHVGDRVDTDVVGAKGAGLTAVYLRAPGAPAAPEGTADHTIAHLAEIPPLVDRLGPVRGPRGDARRYTTRVLPPEESP